MPGRHLPNFPIRQTAFIFTGAEYAGKCKQTRKELFRIEMSRVVSWKDVLIFVAMVLVQGYALRSIKLTTILLRNMIMRSWHVYSS